MLELRNIVAGYGPIEALSEVSIDVQGGQIVSLVGANGAGKSTLLNVVSGIVQPIAGNIRFEGQSIARLSPTEIVRRQIIQVPEGRQVFANLTVLENLELGAYVRGLRNAGTELEIIFALFPRLFERKTQYAGFLSGGEQQMLALGRAIMAKPRLLLLDEPSMGLAPLVIADMFRLIKRLNEDFNITILLVEQNARAALRLSHQAYALTAGKVTKAGTGAALLDDRDIRNAFLGRDARRDAVQT